MSAILVIPILVPLLTAALTLLLHRWKAAQRVLSLTGASLGLVVGASLPFIVRRHGILALQVGSWPAPFGITLAADLFSAIMVAMAGLMGFCMALYSLRDIDPGRERYGYHTFFHVLLMGVQGAFLTGDLFNLYVWFEVMLMASFVMLALGGERPQLEGALKYVALNLVASAIFLAAVGLLYGIAGTLNLADLSRKLAVSDEHVLLMGIASLLIVAFGIKAAVFPLFFWLPASYHTPPAGVTALFAGLLTKVGVYALIRVFTLLFVQDAAFLHLLLLVTAALTMVSGVLGAATQNEFRRILAFHIISQIGYMIMGLGVCTPLALAGAIYYIAHNMVAKTNLILISGLVNRLCGSYELKKLGGLYEKRPALAILFLISAMALAGLPPLSGFFGKLMLVVAGLQAGHHAVVAAALGVSLLTLFSMTKIWAQAFWKADPEGSSPPPLRQAGTLWAPIVLLAALSILMGLFIGPIYDLVLEAAEQLLNPAGYIHAVLGDGA